MSVSEEAIWFGKYCFLHNKRLLRHFIPRNEAKKRLKNSFFKITSENYIFSKNGPENFIKKIVLKFSFFKICLEISIL